MTSLNNHQLNKYNFPFLNIPSINSNNAGNANNANNANVRSNVAVVSNANENQTSFTYKQFIEEYKDFEESNESKLNEQLVELNINNKKYRPNSSKKANQQMTQLYILPEFYILYSKLYSAFQDRQQTTFDFLNSYDDFYRLSQYTFSHENPNVRSINELLRTNSEKKKDNDILLLLDSYKSILNDIQTFQNDNDFILLKINDLIKTFKKIGDRQKNNISELKRKIMNVFNQFHSFFTDKKYFGNSSSSSTSKMFETTLNNTKYQSILNFLRDTDNFERLNSVNSTISEQITFNTLINLVNSLRDDLNDLERSDLYFKDKDSSKDPNEVTKRNTYLTKLNTIQSLLNDISFLYFKIFKTNISSSDNNLIDLLNNLKKKETDFDFNKLIQDFQLIDTNLKYDKTQNESLLNNIQKIIELKKLRDEEKKSEIEKKLKELEDNYIDKKIKLIDELNELKDKFTRLLSLNLKNKNNSQSGPFLTFLNLWLEFLIIEKCIEVNLIFSFIKEKKKEVSKCKEYFIKYKIDKNYQIIFRNSIIESFNHILSYYNSFLDEIKNKKVDLNEELSRINNEISSLGEDSKLTRNISTNTTSISSEEVTLGRTKTTLKQKEESKSIITSKAPPISSSERDRLDRLDTEIYELQRKIDESERVLGEKRKNLKMNEIKSLKNSASKQELTEKKNNLTAQQYSLKELEKDLVNNANEMRKEKLKEIVEKMNDSYIILARIYGLKEEFDKKLKELEKISSQNELITLFENDSLYKIMLKIMNVEVINNKPRGTNVSEPNRTKRGLKRYRLQFNKSVENFKSNSLPFLIQYFEEKIKYHQEKQSILAAFTFNVGNLSKLTQSSYKNLESQKLELNALLTNITANTSVPSTTTSSSSPTTSSSSYSSSSAYNSSTSKYGRSYNNYGSSSYGSSGRYYGGANEKSVVKNEKNKKPKISIYMEFIGKILSTLETKVSSNLNYQNRVQIFIKTIDTFDKSLSEKILEKLKIIQKMNDPQYKFVFAQQVRFIIRRLYKINEFITKIKELYSSNNSFNLVNTYYITDLFLMYLSLNIVFYNFICCIQSKSSKKNSLNY